MTEGSIYNTTMAEFRNKNSVKLARELRRNMTLEERLLWYKYLRSLPVRFCRQKPIDNYIVDFYSPKLKLVIELDGGQHYDEGVGQANDVVRTRALESHGLTVMRFTNTDIKKNFSGVCCQIDEFIRTHRLG